LLSTAGWTKIEAGSDSIFFNLLSQLLAAKAAGRPYMCTKIKGA